MKKVRWGLIGAGDIARKRIAPALRDLADCRFVAVCRSNAALAADFAREFGADRWHADWRDLVADPDIDAVYIATPVYLHAEQTIAAAEAGKHVLCEKPMGLDAAECDRILDACRANGVKIGIAYYRRFYPVVERVRELIATGAIGRVSLVRMDAFEFFDPEPENPRRWLLDPARSGGGPLMDFGCHRIEVLLNLFGSTERVDGFVSNAFFGRAVEDTAVANFGFAGGIIATLTVTHAAREARDTLEIFGDKGTMTVPVLNAGGLIMKSAGAEIIEEHPPAANIHQPLIEDFTRAVLENREPAVTGETGTEVARIMEAIYR